MRRAMNIWVMGGDLRQGALAGALEEDGHTVHTYALENLDSPLPQGRLREAALADCVILPLPVAGEDGGLSAPLSPRFHPLEEILEVLHPQQFVCGGMVRPEVQALAGERGVTIHDYFAREELAVANAVPTVEGAIQIALEELPITLQGARVLVVGFGRLGKLLAHRLGALGARVTVSARRYEQLAWIRAMGWQGQRTDALTGWLCGYDLVVNTVPARVLGREQLRELGPGALVIDLASKPGGVDLEGAAELGTRVIWALSLPGKVAPVTAGRAIRTTVYHMMQELGV